MKQNCHALESENAAAWRRLLLLLLQQALLCHVCAVRRLLLLLLLLLCLLRQHRCRPDGLVPRVSQRGESSSCRDLVKETIFVKESKLSEDLIFKDSGLRTRDEFHEFRRQ